MIDSDGVESLTYKWKLIWKKKVGRAPIRRLILIALGLIASACFSVMIWFALKNLFQKQEEAFRELSASSFPSEEFRRLPHYECASCQLVKEAYICDHCNLYSPQLPATYIRDRAMLETREYYMQNKSLLMGCRDWMVCELTERLYMTWFLSSPTSMALILFALNSLFYSYCWLKWAVNAGQSVNNIAKNVKIEPPSVAFSVRHEPPPSYGGTEFADPPPSLSAMLRMAELRQQKHQQRVQKLE